MYKHEEKNVSARLSHPSKLARQLQTRSRVGLNAGSIFDPFCEAVQSRRLWLELAFCFQ
jgi:hypothetical protein